MLLLYPAVGAAGSSAPTCCTRRCCSGSPAPATCCTGTSTCTRWPGSSSDRFPGVLIGSHLSVRVPERALRIAFGVRADPLGDQARRDAAGGRRSSRSPLVARRGRARSSGRPCACAGATAARTPDPRTRRRVESPGRGPGPVDGGRPRPARGDSAAFAVTEGAKLEKSPIDGHARRSRSSRPAAQAQAGRARPVPAAARASGSTSGSRTRTATRVATLLSNRTRAARARTLELVWDGFSARRSCSSRTASTGRSSSSSARTARSCCRTRSGSTRCRR